MFKSLSYAHRVTGMIPLVVLAGTFWDIHKLPKTALADSALPLSPAFMEQALMPPLATAPGFWDFSEFYRMTPRKLRGTFPSSWTRHVRSLENLLDTFRARSTNDREAANRINAFEESVRHLALNEFDFFVNEWLPKKRPSSLPQLEGSLADAMLLYRNAHRIADGIVVLSSNFDAPFSPGLDSNSAPEYIVSEVDRALRTIREIFEELADRIKFGTHTVMVENLSQSNYPDAFGMASQSSPGVTVVASTWRMKAIDYEQALIEENEHHLFALTHASEDLIQDPRAALVEEVYGYSHRPYSYLMESEARLVRIEYLLRRLGRKSGDTTRLSDIERFSSEGTHLEKSDDQLEKILHSLQSVVGKQILTPRGEAMFHHFRERHKFYTVCLSRNA